MKARKLAPQPGPQTAFLRTPADLCVYGGAAGGGKSFAALLEPLRHVHNPRFSAVVFRRTYPQIASPGGLWDASMEIYPQVGGKPRQSSMEWAFPSGATVRFAHMQYETDKLNWQGSELPLIVFDELCQFTEGQFWYLLSRSRTTCGVRPYVRATCNPDADSWVASFIDWWIGDDGYAIKERSGVMRWMVRIGDDIVWADTPEELRERHPLVPPTSVTFILSTLWDNALLMRKDPGYLARLMSLPTVERERLLGDKQRGGNWKVKPTAGKVFNRAWFEIVDAIPPRGRECRYWDFAATERKSAGDDPDYTAAVRVYAAPDGTYYVTDCIEEQMGPAEGERLFMAILAQDAQSARERHAAYCCRWEIEPGSAGLRENDRLIRKCAGYDAKGRRESGDKLTRARPLAIQAEAGHVKLLRGPWNERWLQHMHAIPDGPHDDIMDSSAGAFNTLARPEPRRIRSHQR